MNALLFSLLIISAELIVECRAQNIIDAFTSLLGAKGTLGSNNDIFSQLFKNPNPLGSVFSGGKGGGLNFASIFNAFQPPQAGVVGNFIPDIGALLGSALPDAAANQSRSDELRNRPTLSSAESEGEGIPNEGGFYPTRRREEQKLTGFSRDSEAETVNDPAYLLLNDGQPAFTSRLADTSADHDIAVEQILKAIEKSNF